jgi:hypothetical protein
MAMIGLGAYIADVPLNTVLFGRLMASTRFVGTAVFGIYLADCAGYSGSVLVQLAKDLFAGHISRLEFMQGFAWLLSIIGTVSVATGCLYSWRRAAADRALSAVSVPSSLLREAQAKSPAVDY